MPNYVRSDGERDIHTLIAAGFVDILPGPHPRTGSRQHTQTP